MSQGYQPEKKQGTPKPPPKNPNGISEAQEKQAMIAGIYAFVAAAKGQRAKEPEPTSAGDIYFNAGFDMAIELAELCIKTLQEAD